MLRIVKDNQLGLLEHFDTMLPVSSKEELLQKEREALKIAIVEARNAEADRLSRLSLQKDKKVCETMESNFDQERRRDQEKISRLLHDYNKLKEVLTSEDIELRSRKMEMAQIEMYRAPPIMTMSANRFHGLEDIHSVDFHKQMTNKIEKHNIKLSRSRAVQNYDPIEEKRKVSGC